MSVAFALSVVFFFHKSVHVHAQYNTSACVTGNDIASLNGIYEYVYFDDSRMSPVYYCSDCSAYLYGDTSSSFYWIIGSSTNAQINVNQWNRCYVGSDLTDYTFDLTDCTEWRFFTNGRGGYMYDADMTALPCPQPSSSPTASPTNSPTPYPTYMTGYLSVDDVIDELMILQLKNSSDGYFSPRVAISGLENPSDSEANTYSILGYLNPDEWRDESDDSFTFKLVYQPQNVTLIWKQTSWLNESTIRGYEAIDVPSQIDLVDSRHEFKGLGLSSDAEQAWMDGNAASLDYWNAVAPYGEYADGGFPGFAEQLATSQTLYIYKPAEMTMDPTTSPTETPTSTSKPTRSPISISNIVSTKAEDTEQSMSAQMANTEESINHSFHYVVIVVVAVFAVMGFIAFLDAKCCCRKNDHFRSMVIVNSFLHVLDTWSDVFNSVNFAAKYTATNNVQFLFICLLSVVFIVLPIIASLVQLHRASTKYWLYDNRLREWLVSYSKLLYFVSVLTGSSFAAVDIFNSDLFGLDVFYMGISRQYLLGFTAKQVYSIVLLENTPQLVLSVWYLAVTQKFELLPVVSIAFSLISIIVTVIALLLQKRIHKTQDYVHISIDVSGQCVVDQMAVCKKRINEFKTFLCRSVLVINQKSVEIQKPFDGDVRNGVRLNVHVAFVHETTETNPSERYGDLLNTSIDNGSLQNALQTEWELLELPEIEISACEFDKSKVKKMESIAKKKAVHYQQRQEAESQSDETVAIAMLVGTGGAIVDGQSNTTYVQQ